MIVAIFVALWFRERSVYSKIIEEFGDCNHKMSLNFSGITRGFHFPILVSLEFCVLGCF